MWISLANRFLLAYFDKQKVSPSAVNISSKFQKTEKVLLCEDEPYSGTLESIEENGSVISNYREGKLHGIQKTYYSTGELKRASMFTKGLENGRRVEYYPCGCKRLNANFSNGQQNGIAEEWERNGKIKSRKIYFRGKLIAIKANP